MRPKHRHDFMCTYRKRNKIPKNIQLLIYKFITYSFLNPGIKRSYLLSGVREICGTTPHYYLLPDLGEYILHIPVYDNYQIVLWKTI